MTPEEPESLLTWMVLGVVLGGRIGPAEVFVGRDFHFGRGRAGSGESLARMAPAEAMRVEIIDQVTLKEMPPEDADQPTEEERLALVDLLRKSRSEARERFDSTGSRTVMRRLSLQEYENTLAALFGRRVDTLGLTAKFPAYYATSG